MGLLHIMLVVIALEVVVLALLLSLSFSSALRNAARRSRRLREEWREWMPEALHGRRNAVERMRRTLRTEEDLRSFHRFIDAMFKGPNKPSSLEVRSLCRVLGFTDWLRGHLEQSRDDLRRAAVAKTLGHLREPIDPALLTGLLESKDSAVVLSAAYAAASTRDASMFLPVLSAIYERTPITLYGAAEVLSRFGPGVCPTIHGLLADILNHYEFPEPKRAPGRGAGADPGQVTAGPADIAAQVIMIDLLAFFRHFSASKVLFELIRHTEHDEVLIHLIKAIAKLGGVRTAHRLRPLLGHENWVVRSQTAVALATLRLHEATSQIEMLTTDPDIRVRAAAQRALNMLRATREPAWMAG